MTPSRPLLAAHLAAVLTLPLVVVAADKIPQTEAASATVKFEAIARTDPAYAGALEARDLEGARKQTGKMGAFKGKVVKVFGTNNVAVLNFHANYKTALTAVLFKQSFGKFPALADLETKEVLVTGKFTEFDGRPQIRLDAPTQIRLVK